MLWPVSLPMSRPPKSEVRRSFGKAASSYDTAAEVQRRICLQLAEGLSPLPPHATVLDTGCGTGFGLSLLQQQRPEGAELIGLDLSPAMVATVAPQFHRIAGDAEQLPLASASIDLYWSSLALQWCDLERALGESHRVLRPGGQLAVATLGPRTFEELRSAFAAADAYPHTLDFLSPEAVLATAKAAGFTQAWIETRLEVAHHTDLRSLLKSIKAIGANQVSGTRRTGLMSRSAWQRAEAAYEALRQPAGLPLSYDVIVLRAAT